jgi:hypothetical protein
MDLSVKTVHILTCPKCKEMHEWEVHRNDPEDPRVWFVKPKGGNQICGLSGMADHRTKILAG